MTILKTILKEEGESFKIHHSSGSVAPSDPAIVAHMLSRGLVVNLNKLPNNIELRGANLDSNVEKTAASKELDPLMAKIFVVDRTLHDELDRQLNQLMFSEGNFETLTDELNKELGELFEHLTSIIKGKMLALVHDYKIDTQTRIDSTVSEIKAKIEERLGKQ